MSIYVPLFTYLPLPIPLNIYIIVADPGAGIGIGLVFVYFHPFHIMLGIQTRGRSMVVADGSYELWRHLLVQCCFHLRQNKI